MSNSLTENNITSLTRYKKPKNFFSWQLFYKCNYHCNYCFEKNLTHYNFNYNELLKTSQNIWKYYKKFGFEWLSIIGGEATLLEVDKLLFLFKNFKNEENLTFELITNFYRPIKYFEKIFLYFKNIKRIIIKVSYHEEYNTLKDFFKKFEELVKISKKYKNVFLKIEFVITEQTSKMAIAYYEYFSFLKKKYSNIGLHLAEAFEYHKGWKLNYLFDSSKLVKYFPFLNKHLTQRRKYIVEKDNSFKIDYSVNFLKQDSKILHTKGCLCFQNEVFLEDNKLKNFCDRNIICDDFMNCNIDDLKIAKCKICENDICSETFVKIINKDKNIC